MRQAECEKCGGRFRADETFKVRESIVCRACAESVLSEERIPAHEVQRQIDPTVCGGCGMDNGDAELAKLGRLPVCPDCQALFKNRPFPVWVKAALVGMVVLVISALVWNSRFIRAYYELRCSGAAMTAGDLERGGAYFISASKRVPENEELRTYAMYYEGLLQLARGKYAEALDLLQAYQKKVPPDPDLDLLIMNAQVAVAFDAGDYDEFLRLSLEINQRRENDPTAAGQVASAYACKYAQTQQEHYKVMSLEALNRAKTLAGTMPEHKDSFAEYEQRILHRLHTGEIINQTEFHERYPNGWTKEGEQTP